MSNLVKAAAAATALLLASSPVLSAIKWDMPTPYGDGVHHTKKRSGIC